ncbi:uncharacterized protein BKA78DRAFT_291868 [Phyllosticta capitalensis]|uniref:uncharacterized protein n=1 Tax=Phyllosticta capitalensis TaxID=121624 RepID=UPI00312DD1CB
MAPSQSCGVCADQPPKYKCPSCELRYCSLACYKTHKSSTHGDPASTASAPFASTSTSSTSTTVAANPSANPPAADHHLSAGLPPAATTTPAQAQPTTVAGEASTPTNPNPTTSPSSHSSPYAPLLTHPALSSLFTRYPSLRPRLARIYASTREPDPDAPTTDSHSHSQHHYNRRGGRGGRSRGGRGRGRGDSRGGGGGYRGGQWKQEVADRSAAKQVQRMRAWEGEVGEGVREFVELVALIRRGEAEAPGEGRGDDGHVVM